MVGERTHTSRPISPPLLYHCHVLNERRKGWLLCQSHAVPTIPVRVSVLDTWRCCDLWRRHQTTRKAERHPSVRECTKALKSGLERRRPWRALWLFIPRRRLVTSISQSLILTIHWPFTVICWALGGGQHETGNYDICDRLCHAAR